MVRAKSKKTLCIIDTCALVDLNNIELARRPLQKWLWKEFEVTYSDAVLEEFKSFQHHMSFREDWEVHVWRFPHVSAYERALFSSHQRLLEDKHCKQCKQITWKTDTFKPDLADAKDRGERYNCCIALNAILEGEYSQVIFLTDDLRAVRDYVAHFFDIFSLGIAWSLLDLIAYLFTRYQNNISLEEAKKALRDVNTGLTPNNERLANQNDIRHGEYEKKQQRLTNYYRKVEQIAQIFSQLSGGR